MIKSFVQVILAMAVSFLVLWGIGMTRYWLIAAIIVIVSSGLIFSTRGLRTNDESAPGPIWVLMTLLISSILGCLWPSLPFAFAWKRMGRQLDNVRSKPEDQ